MDDKQLKASMTKLDKNVGLFGDTVKAVERVLITHVSDIEKATGEELAERVHGEILPAVNSAMKLSMRDMIVKWSIVVAVLLLISCWLGYRYGYTTASGDVTNLTSLIQSQPEVLQQVMANGNISSALETYCHSGSRYVQARTDGSISCDLRVFLNRPTVPDGRDIVISPATIIPVMTEWLRSWNPWVLLISSGVLFIVTRFLISIFCDMPGMRALLALPKKEVKYDSD
ncbi:hypothetical protein ACTOI6_19110 (plasmid) [Komagataeibacter intermedius]|uniref:hypothetical protein n=1 Tax=Komagataeibacter intermedius TaxID=66229 RepID=UPI00403738F4